MPYVLLIWCYSTGSVKHVTMTYQSMSTCIAIIVHHCVTNQNPLTDDSQAESQSQMCKSYNSDQHRPCCESWYGLKSTEAPFFSCHEYNSPHESPKTAKQGTFGDDSPPSEIFLKLFCHTAAKICLRQVSLLPRL